MEQPRDQQPGAKRFVQFTLRAAHLSLLPEKQGLIVDRGTGTITLVSWQDETFLGVIDELSDEQFALVLTLFKRWPSSVPYEMLLKQLGIPLTDQDIEDLERVRMSGRAGESAEEQTLGEQARVRIQPFLQTLRDLLKDCNVSLHDLDIHIVAVMDYGLLLTRYARKKTETPRMEESV